MKLLLKQDGVIKLPDEFLDSLNINTGDTLTAKLGNGCIILEPVSEHEIREDMLRSMSENEETDISKLIELIEGMDI